MRKLILLLWLFPSVLFAQLDRISFNMTEAEFRKAVPEAVRDLESSAGWIQDTGSFGGMQGVIGWKIYNDSIESYHFTSESVQGPSEQFPKADSTAIHDLKVNADRLRSSLELIHGIPKVAFNSCLTCATFMDNPLVYFSEWVIPGNGSISLVISVVQDSEIKTTAVNSSGRKSETYELFLHVRSNSLYAKNKFQVGKTLTEFLAVYPQYVTQTGFTHNHAYVIKDTATCANAKWQFIFVDDVLIYFEYNAFFGSNYGDNDIAAFDVSKTKAINLRKEAKTLCGRPDTTLENIPDSYTVHLDNEGYYNDYLKSEWLVKSGISRLEYREFGGGEFRGSTFHVQFVFQRA